MASRLLLCAYTLLIGLSATACSNPSAMTVADTGVSPRSASKVVVLDHSTIGSSQALVGDRIAVLLKTQLGTGFSWALEEAADKLRLVSESVVPILGQQELDGGYETQVFMFETVAPGQAELTFTYRRPWVGSDPMAKKIRFLVSIVGR
jgi:predicted secreted protein